MKQQKDMLSGIQLAILTISAIMGVGFMSLPAKAIEKMASGGVILTFVTGLITLLFTSVIAYLGSLFPGQTVLDYSKKLVGKLGSKIINGILFIYFIGVASIVVRIFAVTVNMFLLEKTPTEIIIGTILVLSAYLVQNGINPLARICEAFLPIVIIALGILTVVSLTIFDIRELYSFWQIDILTLLKEIPSVMLAYLGFEVLFFAGAFAARPKKLITYSAVAIVFCITLFTLTTAISIGVFGIDKLKYSPYPTLEMARAISFPGVFGERFDILFAVPWIFNIFTTISIFYYLATYNVTRLVGLKNYRPFSYLILPLIYLLSLIPQDIGEVNKYSIWVSYLGVAVVVTVPGILLVIALIRKKGEKKSEKV
ncbi:MAG: endospore germination permease [Clostridiaceae bacterium]|nr:endospore germination permease [Clostridiaceae bacterium]